MRLTVDQQIEENISPDELNSLWAECTKRIYNEDRLIYSVEIDGKVFFNEYESYIRDHIMEITYIHISTLSRIESINETESSLNEYLNSYIPITSSIADQMYGELSQEAWGIFAKSLQGLEWIVNSFDFLHYLYRGDRVKESELASYCDELKKTISELDKNLNENNIVTVGDILQYELLVLLKKHQSGMEGGLS